VRGKNLIGITGTIGSGKSSVAAYWAAVASLPLISLDRICRRLLEPNAPGWLAMREQYGDRFFSAGGDLDRAGLRTALSRDPGLRFQVDSLLHPLALDRMRNQVDSLREGMVLLEIPLLFEAGWQEEVDRIVVVHADRATCRSRITSRDDVDAGAAEDMIRIQMDPWKKAMLADHVIDNRGSWSDACLQVRHLDRIVRLLS